MIYKELMQLADYDIPLIEVYNEQGLLEYVLDLDTMVFEDIDIVWTKSKNGKETCYRVIKLYRDEKSRLNGKDL